MSAVVGPLEIAVIVMGAIIGIRLILAPYWLWKAARSRIAAEPRAAIDYEITAEMVEAGANLLASFSPLEDDPGEMAREVFSAMCRLRPHLCT